MRVERVSLSVGPWRYVCPKCMSVSLFGRWKDESGKPNRDRVGRCHRGEKGQKYYYCNSCYYKGSRVWDKKEKEIVEIP